MSARESCRRFRARGTPGAAALIALSLWLPAATLASDARAQGEAALRAGKLEDAAELLEKAVAASPGDAAAHFRLAQAYGSQASAGSFVTRMRLVGKIQEHYERAVELAPDEVEYRESLLEYYLQAPAAFGGGADKAQAQANEIAARDEAHGLLAAGRIAQHAGNAEAALARYREAASARPEDARIVMRLVLYLQELRRWPEAFEQLNQLLARNPSASSAWYQLGRNAVLANSRHADGEKALRRYISMPRRPEEPSAAAAHWRLGMLYEQQGRKADARLEYQQALKLEPGNTEARAALKKLG
jgi:tetratricopeptide (TPR) repeat protein